MEVFCVAHLLSYDNFFSKWYSCTSMSDQIQVGSLSSYSFSGHSFEVRTRTVFKACLKSGSIKTFSHLLYQLVIALYTHAAPSDSDGDLSHKSSSSYSSFFFMRKRIRTISGEHSLRRTGLETVDIQNIWKTSNLLFVYCCTASEGAGDMPPSMFRVLDST